MSRITLITLAAAVLAAGACTDLNGPNPGPGQGRVAMSMASTSQSAASGPALASEPMSLGSTVLVVSEAQLVLRDIELERFGGFGDCDDSGSGSGGDDDCESLHTGPMLVNLSLDGSARQVINVPADSGTYRRLEFEIHKPEDDSGSDASFIARHPDFRRISIRVKGTWNGTPFVFTSDLNAEQRIELFPPIVVHAGQTTELTMFVDLRRWFLNAAGTAFINPATANDGGQNENLVKSNIRLSIEVGARL